MKKAIIKVVAALIITVLSVGFFAQSEVVAHGTCNKVCPPGYECEWEGDEMRCNPIEVELTLNN